MSLSCPKQKVNTLDEKILIILFSLQEKYNKPYSYPSQFKIISILASHYSFVICRRTLNYHLKYLEFNGFLSRKRRLKRLPNGTLSLATTLYFITKHAYSYLKGLCRFVASILKTRPSWTKQFGLKDQIKTIQREPDPAVRRSKYLETIYETLG